MDNKNKDITYFISFCIEQYMHSKGMSETEVMATFNKYKVLDYLCQHLGVLHTQGRQWLVEEIDEVINQQSN